MLKIWVNHIEVDLPADAKPIRQRLRGVQLRTLGERVTDVTESFKLPATARNLDAIRGGLWWPCTILQDGVPVIEDGRCAVERIAPDYIELTAYGTNSAFFQELAGRALSDLDFTAENEVYTLAGLYANNRLSTTNTVQFPTVVCWPVCQFGQITDGNDIDINYLRPAFMLKGLTDKIAAQAGITLDIPALMAQRYLLACLMQPSDQEGFKQRGKWERERFFSSSPGNTSVYSDQVAAGLIGTTTVIQEITFANAIRPTPNFDGTYFTDPTGADDYAIYYNMIYDATAQGFGGVSGDYIISEWAFELVEEIAGVGTVVADAVVLGAPSVSAYPVFQGTYNTGPVAAGTRYYIRFRVEVSSASGVGSAQWNFALSRYEARFEIEAGTGNYALGSTLDYSALAPDLTQAEYLKLLANLYGLILNYDKKTQTLSGVPIEQVLTSKAGAADWTAYALPAGVGDSAAKFTDYKLDGFGQRTILAHKRDRANQEGRGDGVFVVNRQDLPDEQTIFTVPCASGERISLPTTSAQAMNVRHYEADSGGQLISKFQPELRLGMVILGFDFGLVWTDGALTQAVVPNKFPLYFTPSTRFSSGAEWGVSMSEMAGVYYGTLANLLNDYEAVEVDVILPATEARAFKFDRLVYVESVGHIFVEEISGWAPGLIATLRGVIVP